MIGMSAGVWLHAAWVVAVSVQASIDGVVTVRLFLAASDGTPIRSKAAGQEAVSGSGVSFLCVEVRRPPSTAGHHPAMSMSPQI